MVLTLNQEMNNASATIRPNNSSPTSPVKLFPSKVEGAVFCSVLATEAALIVASNLLTLFLFAVTKKLRKRSLFLICSMACADLMIGTLSLPGYIYLYVGDQFMLWEAKVDLSLDIFFVAVEVIFSQASLISAASISFERLCCLLATETPNIVSATLSPGYFHSLDIGCPYFCARQPFIFHNFSQSFHSFLDFICLHVTVNPLRLQHRHLVEGSTAQ